MLVRYAFGIAVLLSLLFTASPAWAVVRYTVTDLGTLGGATARPGDINNSGQIVGSSKASDGSDRAFLYENGRMTDLGSFPDTSWTCANGINDSGQIVGYSGSYALGAHGFLYENGELVDIGNLPSLKNCVPRDINSTGLITGYSYESTGNGAHGFIFHDDLRIDIGWPIDSYGRRYWGVIPNQINASGEIVGHVHTAAGRECPFLYGNGLWIVLEDLEARLARASGINDRGQVVGWSSADSRRYAFLYEDGIVTNLSTDAGLYLSEAQDINAAGQIVGMCSQEFGVYYASSYSNGVWSNLNECIDPASGWILDRAVAVNDSGWIVGTGRHNGEDTRAFLLVPVPEPTSLVLLYACSLALALLRIR